MIAIEQLLELGWLINTELLKGGFDLNNPDKEYLVSLSPEGEVNIIHPHKANKVSESFTDIDELNNFFNNN